MIGNQMKKCSYCGAEYPDDAAVCAVDRTPLEGAGQPLPPPPPPKRTEYQLGSLSEEDRRKDLVTLVKCGTLSEADMIATQLRAAGIEVFLPDEFVMQSAYSVISFGYVRVQISPKDYDAARNLLVSIHPSA
jgi:hypothetical protein